MPDYDVIDEVLAITPDDPLDRIRAARPAARDNAQRSFDALFSPVDSGAFSPVERYAVAAFVTGLGREPLLHDYYTAGLEQHPAIASEVRSLIAATAGTGPYGRYREVALGGESTDGPRLAVAEEIGYRLGTRLTAALEHAHLLVFRPREASTEALQRLLDAGWSVDGIVTLSQLVAFVSFQLRVVIGLGALQADLSAPAAAASIPTDEEGDA